MGACLSWGNREYHDEDNPERSRTLNDRALGGVEALRDVIYDIESPTWADYGVKDFAA